MLLAFIPCTGYVREDVLAGRRNSQNNNIGAYALLQPPSGIFGVSLRFLEEPRRNRPAHKEGEL